MKTEKFDYQGKTRKQVENSARGFGYSLLALLLIVLFALLFSNCVPSERFINKDQKKRVKEIRRQSLRSEAFDYSDSEIFHVAYNGKRSRMTLKDLEILKNDTLIDYYLFHHAERPY